MALERKEIQQYASAISRFRVTPSLFPTKRVIVGCCCAAFWLGIAAASNAGTTVSISLRGEIAPRCATSGGNVSTIAIDELRSAGSREDSLPIDCNAPFVVTFASEGGGLVANAGSNGGGVFDDRVPYVATLEIPTDAGLLVLSCDSRNMLHAGCGPADSRGGIAIAKVGRIEIRWSDPEKELLAGRYEDRLMVLFQPKL